MEPNDKVLVRLSVCPSVCLVVLSKYISLITTDDDNDVDANANDADAVLAVGCITTNLFEHLY